MQLKQILQIGKDKLEDVSRTAVLDVEILLGYVLGLSRTDLILKDDLELNAEQEEKILDLFERRTKNEPIAYLINEKEFYGLKFYVDENVLIPRPETEVLVEEVLDFVKNQKVPREGGKGVFLQVEKDFFTASVEADSSQNDATLQALIIDVGTGSGCIPITLAQNLENVEFVAIDVSEKALEVARRNVTQFNLENRVEVVKGDLLEVQSLKFKVQSDQKDIIITANLPYVEENAKLEKNVKNYEPHLALFAGEDGLDLYRRFLEQAVEIQPLAIFLEIDPKQVKLLKEISEKLLPKYEVEVLKDLAGKKRVFVLKK